MILKEIHIDGFGIFHGFTLDKLDRGVHIIRGENEAGKSTLLKFLRFTLFGYPRFHDQRMPPLQGGKHGGRIRALFLSGEEAVFARTSDDRIKLTYRGQESTSPTLWSQLLGYATAALFSNVYAISLDELADLKQLNESGMQDKLFSVGLGMGNTSIGDIEKDIQELTDRLYTPRGRNQKIPHIMNALEEKSRHISGIQEHLPRYTEHTGNIKMLEEQLKQMENRLDTTRREKTRLEHYLKCYPSFIAIKKAEKELKELPPLRDYPENASEEVEKLEEKENELKERLETLMNGNGQEEGIRGLEEKAGKVKVDEQLLEQENTIVHLKENLEKYRQARHDRQEEEEQVEKLQQSINAYIQKIGENWCEEDVLRFTGHIVHKNRISEFRDRMTRAADRLRNAEAVFAARLSQERQINVKNLMLFLAVVLLTGTLAAAYYRLYVLAGVLAVTAAGLLTGKNYLLNRDLPRRLENELEEARKEEQQVKKKYEQYLKQELNLPPSLSPEAALEMIGAIEQVVETIARRNKLKEKISHDRLPFIRKTEETARSLRHFLSEGGTHGDTAEIIEQLSTACREAVRAKQTKENLLADIDRRKKEYENAENRLKEIRQTMREWIDKLGASDRDNLKEKIRVNRQVKNLLETKRNAEETIETIAGLGKAGEVLEYLGRHGKDILETREMALAEEIRKLEQDIREKSADLGALKNELSRMEGESELAGALTSLESEKEKLRMAWKEWLTGKLALRILQEVKSLYEKEKQPEVVKKATRHFARVTGQRYTRLSAGLDPSGEVRVYDRQENAKKVAELSRGTREQLLLSLRLGYIEEYERQAEPLPLIVDEVLVNFDPARARRTAELLQEFAAGRQVLIFTCHPSTEKYFDPSAVRVIPLRQED